MNKENVRVLKDKESRTEASLLKDDEMEAVTGGTGDRSAGTGIDTGQSGSVGTISIKDATITQK